MNAPHKIDVNKGECIGTVSSQWFGRSDDQRFTSLSDLRAQVAAWADASLAEDIDPGDFHASAGLDNGLLITHPKLDIAIKPTNYGFGDLCSLVGAPSRYLSRLGAGLAADCLNHGFENLESSDLKQVYIGGAEAFGEDALRCLTSTKYGRITDRDVVDTVMKMAGNGTGDTRWKVPGMIDWSNMTYNPNVDITKENTTLYASDRDVFLFLVDDKNPIEVGKLANGDPDLMFRGFYVWNSEVGERTFGVATMYLRGVCMNRNLWGVEGFTETSFRHTAGAPDRFLTEAAPALESYAETGASKLVAGVKAAKDAIVAKTPEERVEFLTKFGFSKSKATDLITTHIVEEGREPNSVWDFAQAMTAAARQCHYQDQRVKLEQQAGKLLDKITVD